MVYTSLYLLYDPVLALAERLELNNLMTLQRLFLLSLSIDSCDGFDQKVTFWSPPAILSKSKREEATATVSA